MPTCIKWDRFFLGEFVKKYPKQADIEGLFERVKTLNDVTFEEEFGDIITGLDRTKMQGNVQKE